MSMNNPWLVDAIACGIASPAASSISTLCSSVAPEYSLWGNTRGTTQTIRSTQALAALASSRCATVGGLKLPASIPTLFGPELFGPELFGPTLVGLTKGC